MSAKVLVTGASGYVAGHVVQQLQEAGHVVRGTVRSVQEDKVRPLHGLCPKARHPLQLVQADLLQSDSWTAAVEGMDYVIHTASPFVMGFKGDEQELIRPAVEGTLNVLRACAKTPSVKRVVLTSSCVAVDYSGDNKPTATPKINTEADWTNTDAPGTGAYVKSKTLAEKAAWDFVKNVKAPDNKFELAVINPNLVLGPVLKGSSCASLDMIKVLLEGAVPKVDRFHVGIVDVRDVAKAHIVAMTKPEAAGNRHLLTAQSTWYKNIAVILQNVFGPQGYQVPTDEAEDSNACRHLYDNTRMRKVLGISPRDLRDSIIDMAYAAIEAGLIKRTEGYRGPGGPEERQRYQALQLQD